MTHKQTGNHLFNGDYWARITFATIHFLQAVTNSTIHEKMYLYLLLLLVVDGAQLACTEADPHERFCTDVSMCVH